MPRGSGCRCCRNSDEAAPERKAGEPADIAHGAADARGSSRGHYVTRLAPTRPRHGALPPPDRLARSHRATVGRRGGQPSSGGVVMTTNAAAAPADRTTAYQIVRAVCEVTGFSPGIRRTRRCRTGCRPDAMGCRLAAMRRAGAGRIRSRMRTGWRRLMPSIRSVISHSLFPLTSHRTAGLPRLLILATASRAPCSEFARHVTPTLAYCAGAIGDPVSRTGRRCRLRDDSRLMRCSPIAACSRTWLRRSVRTDRARRRPAYRAGQQTITKLPPPLLSLSLRLNPSAMDASLSISSLLLRCVGPRLLPRVGCSAPSMATRSPRIAGRTPAGLRPYRRAHSIGGTVA